MKRSGRWLKAALAIVLVWSCASAARDPDPPIVQPGAPGEASRPAPSGHAAGTHQPAPVADVRFMQGMIVHHAQALVMTGLAAARTAREDIRTLAARIEASQADEILLMERWLEASGKSAPVVHAHHGHEAAGDHERMPGMLTAEELNRLAAAAGADFDRLFLEFMIRHHEGALVMVAELFATEDGGQHAQIFQFASHVDSDQRIEIARMRAMLRTSPQ